MELVVEPVHLDDDAAFAGVEAVVEQGHLGRVHVFDHLLAEAADHDVETNSVLDGGSHERRVQMKVDEGARLLEDVVLTIEQLPAGVVDDLHRVGFVRVGQRLQRGVLSDEMVGLGQKELRVDLDRVPAGLPLGWNVFVDVVCAEPSLGLAADVLVLARVQEDVDAVRVEMARAVGDQV